VGSGIVPRSDSADDDLDTAPIPVEPEGYPAGHAGPRDWWSGQPITEASRWSAGLDPSLEPRAGEVFAELMAGRVAINSGKGKAAPKRGWRRSIYACTFGLVNPGPSSDEHREALLEAAIGTRLAGRYKVGAVGKGGVGKTTVAACLGSIFAERRRADRVVAIDADTGFGKLGARIDPGAASYWELTATEPVGSFVDSCSQLGCNTAGLFVLAGEQSGSGRRSVLTPALYRQAVARLDRHFTISIVDCGSALDLPVTREVLRDLDAIVIVAAPRVDGASAALQKLEWLDANGMTDLLDHAVIVINDSDGHADKRTRDEWRRQLSSHGWPVFEVPFDPNLRAGGVVNVSDQLAAPTRQSLIEIAAALGERFASDR
jgi:MinD-like ATPase involved in chromosome partitioning or flagellar assembly